MIRVRNQRELGLENSWGISVPRYVCELWTKIRARVEARVRARLRNSLIGVAVTVNERCRENNQTKCEMRHCTLHNHDTSRQFLPNKA